MKGYRFGKMFIPPGKVPSLVFPGYDGGGEWGGPAADPETGILYVNANEMAWIMKMNENPLPEPKKESWFEAGLRLYQQHCQACHGADRNGTGNNPTLINVRTKYNLQEILDQINNGRRMMPAFKHLGEEEKDAIAAFILERRDDFNKEFKSSLTADTLNHVPYKMSGYIKFLSPEGYPAISPPWGTLNAIDLNSGEFVWKIVLGEYDELKARGIPPTGTENYGGPVVTAGGLVFIAATRDNKFRAFDKRNGKLLWEYTLPASGFATPSVYELEGRQYIVIACGGGKLNTRSGDAYVAFALPRPEDNQ
jgi:quinoprotein glucose dehydrogenase